MKILITSGGTKVPIDRVRFISNMSHGTFGSKIATECLKLGHEVDFLRATGSCSPFSINIDFHNKYSDADDNFRDIRGIYEEYKNKYSEHQYKTFDQYYIILMDLILNLNVDVIVLAAAVSDYGVKNYVDGKIRSKNDLFINLEPLPKIISKVKEWAPKSKLVGFKLLVNSTTEIELYDASRKSMEENKCDLIVANDLKDIQNNNHKIYLLDEYGCWSKYYADEQPDNPNYLAGIVAKEIERL